MCIRDSGDAQFNNLSVNQAFNLNSHVNITGSATTSTTLAVTGAVSQTAPLFDVKQSGGNSQITTTAQGDTTISSLITPSITVTSGSLDNTTIGASVKAPGSFTNLLASSSFTLTGNSSITSIEAATTVSNIRGATGQIAPLLNVEDSSGNDHLNVSNTLSLIHI